MSEKRKIIQIVCKDNCEYWQGLTVGLDNFGDIWYLTNVKEGWIKQEIPPLATE